MSGRLKRYVSFTALCVCATYLCSVASGSIDVRCVRYHDMSVLTKKKSGLLNHYVYCTTIYLFFTPRVLWYYLEGRRIRSVKPPRILM